MFGKKFFVRIKYRSEFPGGLNSGTWQGAIRARDETDAIKKAFKDFIDEVELLPGSKIKIEVVENLKKERDDREDSVGIQ